MLRRHEDPRVRACLAEYTNEDKAGRRSSMRDSLFSVPGKAPPTGEAYFLGPEPASGEVLLVAAGWFVAYAVVHSINRPEVLGSIERVFPRAWRPKIAPMSRVIGSFP